MSGEPPAKPKGYTLHCRSCDWSIEEPIELKGEANWLAGRHIAETGHSVNLERVDPDEEEDFRRGGGRVEVLGEHSFRLP